MEVGGKLTSRRVPFLQLEKSFLSEKRFMCVFCCESPSIRVSARTCWFHVICIFGLTSKNMECDIPALSDHLGDYMRTFLPDNPQKISWKSISNIDLSHFKIALSFQSYISCVPPTETGCVTRFLQLLCNMKLRHEHFLPDLNE